MTSFTVKLADVPIRIYPVHREMAFFLRDYLSAEEPRFEIRMDEADIDAMFVSAPNDEKFVIDVKSVLDKNAIEAAGYRYWRL